MAYKVKFGRGAKEKYDSSSFANGIFFATDTKEIFMNGNAYGGCGIEDITIDGNVLSIVTNDGESHNVTIPYATATSGGLMSADDKAAIDSIEQTIANAITKVLGDLNYTDTAVDASFVTAVNEADGVINVTRGKVVSTDGSITVTPGDDGGIDLSANIPEVPTYTGKDAIAIENYEVSLKLAEGEKAISQSEDGLKITLKVNYDSTKHTVQLLGIDDELISEFDATEFIVDGMIQSATLVHENPDTGATGEFLAITFNTEGGATTTIYIDVTELIDTYLAGNGLALDDHTFSVVIADSDEGFLQSTATGIKTEGIKDAISEAVSTETTRAEAKEAELEAAIEKIEAATVEVEAAAENQHVTVTKATDSEGATTFTVNENDIASAADVTALTTRVTEIEEALEWVEFD